MGETNKWSSLPEEKRPKFYMIIHNAIIQNESLELPAKFVKKIEKDLDNDVVPLLKVPNGDEWVVKMIRESTVDNGGGGGVWFRNGIREFIDYYSISPGHFLVFRYDGNLQFQVLIFDMTCSEIGYHLYGDNGSSGSLPHNGCADDPSEHSNAIDDSDNIESFKTVDSEEDLDHVEISSGSPTDTDESDEDDDEAEFAEMPSRKNTRNSSNAKEYVARADAIEREFTSNYPFFRVILQTSYMKSHYLPIPYAIRRLYYPDDVKDVKVTASDGRFWSIGVLRPGTDDMRLCKGIRKFVNKKNGLNLKVGDVLIFEIVKKRCLKVNVFRY